MPIIYCSPVLWMISSYEDSPNNGFCLGPIASAALGLITVPFIAWFYTPEDIGRFAIQRAY